MRKENFISEILLAIVISIFIAVGHLYAESNWVPVRDPAISNKVPPAVQRVNSNNKELIISYVIQGFEVTDAVEQSDGELYHHLSLPQSGSHIDVGKPEFPQIGQSFGIPKGADIKIEIIDATFNTLEGYNVYPAQEPPKGKEQPAFQKNMQLYGKDEFYPPSIFIQEQPQILRGLQTSIVRLIPFQFNPVKKQLRVYTDVKIKISFDGDEEIFLDKEFRTPGNESFYTHLVNFPELGPFTEQIWIDGVCPRDKTSGVISQSVKNKIGVNSIGGGTDCFQCHGFEHIIITYNNSSFRQAAESLMKWCNQKGIMTDYVTTYHIGGSTTTDIKNFIKSAYDKSAYKPKYVTLLGDVGYVATYQPSPYTDTPATDLYYVTMDVGNEYMPDIYIGRISVSPSLAGQTVAKILNYEKDPYKGSSWFSNTLFVSQTYPNFDQFIPTSDEISNYLYTQDYSYNRQYWGTGYSGSTTNIINGINTGAFVVNYFGHGLVDKWVLWNGPTIFDMDDIDSLNNATMPPVVFSVCCLTGSFQSDCLGEKFVRESNKGAVGFVGATRETDNFFNVWFDKGLFDTVWVNFYNDTWQWWGPKTQMGEVLHCARYFMSQHCSSTEYNLERKQYEGWHYLGAPAMNLRTSLPEDLNAICNNSIPVGSQTFNVLVKDGCGNVEPDARVTLSDNTQNYYIHKGITNSNGNVTFNTNYTQTGQVIVTVTKYNGYSNSSVVYNYKPYTKTINIVQ